MKFDITTIINDENLLDNYTSAAIILSRSRYYGYYR